MSSSVFAFTAGIALVWVAAIAIRMRRDKRALGWIFLAVFAAALGAAQLIGLAIAGAPSTAVRLGQLVVSAAGFFALVEFGRCELRDRFSTLRMPWVYAVLVAAAAIKFALAGLAGLETVCCYGFAPLGGLLATAAIAQRVRVRRSGDWSLPLMAAAIAFFAIGFALSISALQAFAAMGLLAGIWREHRDESPLPQHTGVFARWRAPGAFVVLTLLGCAGLVAFGQAEKGASVVVQAGAPSEAADATSAAVAADGIEVDSRQFARERANSQRYKQGLSILIVVAIVAAVWVGLSRLQRRM
jgi:hypothetical protein